MNKFIRDRVLDSDEIGSLKNIASEAKKLEAELLSQVQKVVKPVYHYSVDGYGYFCTCKPKNESLPELFRHYDHCPKCGSKLDWSEVQ